MRHSIVISNQNLSLRPLEQRDVEALREWRNDREISRFLSPIPYITPDMQKAWFARYLDDPTEMTFAIDYINNEGISELIGSISMSGVEQGRGECGKFMIGNSAYKGKGFGRKSLALCLKASFTILDLDVCFAHANPLNYPSFVSFVNEGFQIIGSRPFQDGIEYKMKLTKQRYQRLNEEE